MTNWEISPPANRLKRSGRHADLDELRRVECACYEAELSILHVEASLVVMIRRYCGRLERLGGRDRQRKKGAHQLVRQLPSRQHGACAVSARPLSYWSETSRPLVNLMFVAPLLVAYEGGLLWLGPVAMRNGADVWLRQLLELAGFSQYFLLPTMIIGILLAWHHLRHDQWKVRSAVLYGMLVESILFGGGLLFVARCHQALLSIQTESLAGRIEPTLGNVVAYLGAGVYEELIFRMIALSALVAIVKWCGCSKRTSWCLSMSLSSVAFAAAHYQFQFGAAGSEWMTSGLDGFIWSTFVFRFSAGILFCLLFLFRGFGIAVGAHALYDILVGC